MKMHHALLNYLIFFYYLNPSFCNFHYRNQNYKNQNEIFDNDNQSKLSKRRKKSGKITGKNADND